MNLNVAFNISIFIYLFILRFWAFLCFLSACEDLIKAARESWCSGMRIRWRGIRCQTTIIFLYLHSFLPYLALCAYLGSGCSRISSALPWPLPLPSTLPTQVAFLPAASQQACTTSRERERESERDSWIEMEGKDCRRQIKYWKKNFTSQR